MTTSKIPVISNSKTCQEDINIYFSKCHWRRNKFFPYGLSLSPFRDSPSKIWTCSPKLLTSYSPRGKHCLEVWKQTQAAKESLWDIKEQPTSCKKQQHIFNNKKNRCNFQRKKKKRNMQIRNVSRQIVNTLACNSGLVPRAWKSYRDRGENITFKYESHWYSKVPLLI